MLRRCLLLLIGSFALIPLTAGEAFNSQSLDLSLSPADAKVYGADASDLLASSLAAGDFNGDGIDDLLLGAQADGLSNAKADAGEAYVVFGSPSISGTFDLATTAPGLTVIGADAGDGVGYYGDDSVAAGDFNGDGIDDLLLGAYAADGLANAKSGVGEAYVIFGSPSLGGTINLATTAPGLTVIGADAGDNLSLHLTAGDFNGDGIDDLLLGAANADGVANAKSAAGEAYVIFGSSTLGGTRNLATTAPGFTVIGADAGDNLGSALAAGDFNGDRIDDLLIGAYLADGAGNAKSGSGEAYVILGSPTLGGTKDLASSGTNFTVFGGDIDDGLSGWSIAAGDFNGDTVDDLLLGAANADAAGNAKSGAGEAYVVLGSANLSGLFLTTVIGADAGDGLTQHVKAGDVNGDGVDDLVLGAPFADAAGNAKADAGEAYVVFGSPTLAATKDIAVSAPDFTVVAADAFDNLGSLASGDFNGDGIGDLLVGAPFAAAAGNAKPGAGEAYVIFGRCASGTTNSDTDSLCDPFDPDDDNDGSVDVGDQCSTRPEDFDGFQDSDGCPDPDNDSDGVCDAGQTSASCIGSDTGKLCFDPAGTLSCTTQDCRNIGEDFDAFKDTDGCPEPDNDNDGFPDATDQCPGAGSGAGADGMLGSPQDLNHNGIQDGGEATLTTDDVPTYAFEDRDGVLDTDGCHDSPGEDFDADGYTDDNEALKIGTDAGYPCGIGGWPSNVFDGGASANKFDVQDIISFVAPVRRLDTNPTGPTASRYNPRWDLSPGVNSPFTTFISIYDVTTMLTGNQGSPAYPPMFGGPRAFGKTCPLASQ